jgi:hypothetical protein
VPPSPAELRKGKFNAPKKADRKRRCFSADHRAYSGILGDCIGNGRLVGISALAEPRLSLHEGCVLRLKRHSESNLVNNMVTVQAPMTEMLDCAFSVSGAVTAVEPVLNCEFGGVSEALPSPAYCSVCPTAQRHGRTSPTFRLAYSAAFGVTNVTGVPRSDKDILRKSPARRSARGSRADLEADSPASEPNPLIGPDCEM